MEINNFVQEIIDRGLPVIVEGKKDAAALRALGINNIVEMDVCFKIVDKLEHEKEVAILVDLDREGKKIYSQLNDAFSRRGVKVNNNLRHYLFRETKVRQIEALKDDIVRFP